LHRALEVLVRRLFKKERLDALLIRLQAASRESPKKG
jgi:hypothetical protein